MNTVIPKTESKSLADGFMGPGRRLSALEVATHAVVQLENHPLFNSGHGAVFTRDGINELEASVMVSRGFKKRGVGVMGLRRVRNPILLARKMLEHGEQDLAAPESSQPSSINASNTSHDTNDHQPNVPSAQGHTQLFGTTAESLAQQYGLEMVDPAYFFTQKRWDEHRRALEREAKSGVLGTATWHPDEYLPQGTCGAVALDEDGVVCAATSTGGLTNKLTGRIGDTPVVGAGFWAEEWTETGDPTRSKESINGGEGAGGVTWERLTDAVMGENPGITFAGPLKGLLADCLPTPWTYSPLDPSSWHHDASSSRNTTTTRSMGASGTGNGDSFLRINAVHAVAAMARWKPVASATALTHIAGPDGELQRSAGDRWGKTGEGEGGIIGIECAVVRNPEGVVVGTRSEILMDHNCGGMYRAWIDDHGKPVMSIWTNGGPDKL